MSAKDSIWLHNNKSDMNSVQWYAIWFSLYDVLPPHDLSNEHTHCLRCIMSRWEEKQSEEKHVKYFFCQAANVLNRPSNFHLQTQWGFITCRKHTWNIWSPFLFPTNCSEPREMCCVPVITVWTPARLQRNTGTSPRCCLLGLWLTWSCLYFASTFISLFFSSCIFSRATAFAVVLEWSRVRAEARYVCFTISARSEGAHPMCHQLATGVWWGGGAFGV